MGPDAHLLHYAIGAHAETVNFLAVLEGPAQWEHGDAVHAMLLHHGQGANQSVEDAAVLADLLVAPGILDGDHYEAFARYGRLHRCRTRQVQRSSLVTSGLLHLPDGRAADERDAGLAGLDPWLSWIHGVDARAGTRPVPA
ncbi:FAD-dependent oxidoreductase [Pseudonocardia sp. HH130629-09]|uniref:FAD-dependent oxidoreductase n=1 Tax=Pseudonocardia sp. HH130629-09 TaxID=1641402 RepID=UPI000761C6AC